jgi:hypothetical protein
LKLKFNTSKAAEGEKESTGTPKEEKKKITKKPKKMKPSSDEEGSKASEPPLSAEEVQKRKEKPILWFRHQLQRRFLSTETEPNEEVGLS